MNHLKRFALFESTNWSGTIRIDSSTPSDIMKHWTRMARMPERYLNYIKSNLKLEDSDRCGVNGPRHQLGIGMWFSKIEIYKFDLKPLREGVIMSAGSNMYRTLKIEKIEIELSAGEEGILSEDGYFNVTIYCLDKLRSEYKFTSETIEDLCEFLNGILVDGEVKYNSLN